MSMPHPIRSARSAWLRTRRDRRIRPAAPVRERSDVEPPGRKAREIESEERMAGGNAAAAGGDDVPRAGAELLVEGPQLRRRKETAVAQIRGYRSVDGARDVPGARIE